MNKLPLSLLIAALILAVLVLGFRIVTGVFSLLGSAVDAVLGVVVILALAVIVIWMFRYAKRH